MWPWPWPLTYIYHNIWTVACNIIFHMCIPCDNTFPSIPTVSTLWHWPWRLTYIYHNIWTVRGRVFIFHMFIPLNKTFTSVIKVSTLWPWPLTFILTIFTCDKTVPSEPIFLPCHLYRDHWIHFENLYLDYNFLTVRGRAFIFPMCFTFPNVL